MKELKEKAQVEAEEAWAKAQVAAAAARKKARAALAEEEEAWAKAQVAWEKFVKETRKYAGCYDAGFKAGLKGGMAVTVERCLSIIDNAIACYGETEGAQRQALKICGDHVRGLLPDHNYSERKLPDLRVDHEDVMFFRKI